MTESLVQGWEDQGNCKRLNPYTETDEINRIFFPGRGSNATNAQKEFCSNCPVIVECLAKALDNDELGIWAGTTEADRRNMRKHKKVVVTSKLITTKKAVITKHRPTVILVAEDNDLEVDLFELDGPTDADLVQLETG